MRVLFLVLSLWAIMAGREPGEASAQVGRAALGGAAGAAGGGVVTISIVVARAHLTGEYLDHPQDLIHWQSAPMLVGPAVGVAFGLAGRETLERSVVGAASGLVIGAAVGAGIGRVISDEAEGPWAGGVIGAGIGLTAGALVLGVRSWLKEKSPEDGAPLALGFRVSIR